jgi:uncharacterized damage-inducible protein DinB
MVEGDTIGTRFASELGFESISMLKCVERLPADKMDWRPHDKSMTLSRLAGHLVEMLDWIPSITETDGINFADYKYSPKNYQDGKEIASDLRVALEKADAALRNVTDESMRGKWTMKAGDVTLSDTSRAISMRSFIFNHLYHHRGQLSVYMRLLDIPVPSIYGPSADEGASA